MSQISQYQKLAESLKNTGGLSGKQEVENRAQNAIDATRNSIETQVGGKINEISGGVQSLTQKYDKAQNILNNTTTEGLLTDGAASVQNMATDLVNDQVSKITGAFGAKVEVEFEEVDGITLPKTSSLDATGGVSGSLSSVIALITGLGVNSLSDLSGAVTGAAKNAVGDLTGSLQKAVIDASPEGLLKAGQDLTGKIGGFSASTINSLASNAVSEVTDQLQTAFDAIPSVARDIGLQMTLPTSVDTVDSDGNGNINEDFGDLVESVITSPEMPTISSQFDALLNNVKTDPLQSLNNFVTSSSEIKQNLTSAAAKNDFSELSGGKNGADVIKSTQTQNALRSQYVNTVDTRNSLVQSQVAGDGGVGIVQSLSVETLTDLKKQVKDFAPKLSDKDVQRVIALSQGNSQEFSLAVDLMFQSTGKNADEIRSFLKSLDATITAAVSPEIDDAVFDEPYIIGSFAKLWNKGQGDPVFPYISSIEELQAELRNVNRDVTEVVVHWTETPTNKNIGSEEINAIHLEAGLNGIGYHYVIRRDGSLQRGRPVNIQGEHAVNNGHNDRSIGIAFVGGINVPSETDNIENFLSVRSLTRSQFNTFDHFCRSFYNVFSGGQIVGHQDIDELTSDPGFDVRAYVKANFDKDSKFTDPLNQGPFTVDEINS